MVKILVSSNYIADTKVRNSIILGYDNWNDYNYITTFNVRYCDNNNVTHQIGTLKIYNCMMDEDTHFEKTPLLKVIDYLPDEYIDQLSNDFCSLGQDIDYYRNIKMFLPGECIDILTRLRDMSVTEGVKEKFSGYHGVKMSLLRFETAVSAMEKARVLFDDDGVEDYSTIDVELDQNDENIYPYTSIKVERDQYSIYEMKRKHNKGRIKLDPSFQRNFVWNQKQQSELIESVIMGIPLPLIYLAENKEGELIVVDGRQRLTTFIRFLDNEFRLSGLRILTKLNGKNYAEIEEEYPGYASTIEDYQLVIQVIRFPTPDRIKFDIFDRVNRGGTNLNKQEMRNALYQGKATELLQKLTDCEEFKLATGEGISGKHMKDRYIVLRAIAFQLLFQNKIIDKSGSPLVYKSDMDDLMARTMEYLNKCNDDECDQIETVFKRIMKRCYDVLGQDAFRIGNDGGRKRPISMTLFETLFFMLFSIREENVPDEVIQSVYRRLFEDDKFMEAIQYSVDSAKNVDIRFTKAEEYAKEMIKNVN